MKSYGSSLLKEGDQVRVVLVMELCKENLMRHIFLNPKNIPARIPSSTPTERTTIQWAKDIANGLEYIHEQGYVHRDLKLENILVRKQDVSVLLGLVNCIVSISDADLSFLPSTPDPTVQGPVSLRSRNVFFCFFFLFLRTHTLHS